MPTLATDRQPNEPARFDDLPLIDAGTLAGLLADGDRRRVAAALILGAASVDEVKTATGLSTRAVGRALSRLVDAGLVVRDDDGRHWLVEDAFRQAAIAAAPAEKTEAFDAPDDAARVLRAFVRDQRLLSIPSHHAKRLVVLDYVVQEFEPGRHYSEREVNARLARWFDDVASLRRYLVDEGLLGREPGGGAYWRSGGTVEV
jgi:predicted transcriptional regulator